MEIVLKLTVGELLEVLIAIIAALGAIYIGVQQNKINKRLLDIQDTVDVYLAIGYPEEEKRDKIPPVIMIHNISSLPISLVGYTFNGVDRKISPYRLPPAIQFPAAHYYINLFIKDMEYVSFLLELEDSFERKWKVKGFAEVRNGKWEISSEKPVCENTSS